MVGCSQRAARAAHRDRSADQQTCTTAALTYQRTGWGLIRSVDGGWLRSGVSLCMVNVWRA
jgi:hypothetical protein